jgi:predicted RNA-binding protein YlqC (UPF0109 family)
MSSPTKCSIRELLDSHSLEDATTIDISVVASLLIGLLSGDLSSTFVQVESTSRVTLLTFEVSDGGKGRTIGKNGHTIKAVRSLCRSIERSRGRDVIIDLPGYEDSGS